MKKLVLILAVAFGASMVACSSSEKANEENANAEAAPEVEIEAAVVNDTIWLNDTTAVVGTDTIIVAKVAAPAPEEAPAEEGK